MQRPLFRNPFFDQRGQTFAGYIVAILLVTSTMVAVGTAVRRNRSNTDNRIYQDQALALAKQGFEEGLSFFRRQPSGVYLTDGSAEKPLSQAWASPWPIHPDSAFLPQAADTDHYNKLSFAANITMTGNQHALFAQRAGARAIIRTFPLLTVASLTTTAELSRSPVWGRYVIRRQNTRNWSPGPNTFAAFTDPEAAHDLTHIRNQSTVPGAGNYWSLVSRGYVFTNALNVTYGAAYENSAMFEGGNLVSAPKRFYLNKPFLLASARVYGELYRINFKNNNAAVWMGAVTGLTVNTNGIVNGGSQGNGVVVNGSTTCGTCGGFVGGISSIVNVAQSPSVPTVFPGLDTTKLKALADLKGDMNVFPTADQSNLSEVASRPTFYYITGTTSTFVSGASARVMTGVGLVFVEGNLVFNPGNLSAWSGIVYVQGNCTVRGPVELSGALIVTGTLTVGNSADINKANVEYNQDAVTGVTTYLQRFRVDKNSILAAFN